LALAQTNSIAAAIRVIHPDLEVAVSVIKTTGDKFTASSLSALAEDTKGLFVKEIEEALLAGSVDLAVHSLKDVPTELPEGLCLGVTPEREEPWDALVSNQPLCSLDELPRGAKVGTSSLRRKFQLASLRPDLEIVPIRGNIDTRIRKLREKQFDGIVLAAAGLSRLRISNLFSYKFPVEEMVPAIGQGCLALEVREDNDSVKRLIQSLDHPKTRESVNAERFFLKCMGGGCQVPMGAYTELNQDQAQFFAFLASPRGDRTIKQSYVGRSDRLDDLVEEAVTSFRTQGSESLMKEVD
jgi:hydroxymethylbilane synthase